MSGQVSQPPLQPVQAVFMKRNEVVAFTGLCYTTLYNLEKTNDFPLRRTLSPGRVAWVRTEVETWVNTRCAVLGILSDGAVIASALD